MNVVEDDGNPPWTFTIGLYDTWQHRELIVIGRSRATAHEMLSAIAGESKTAARRTLQTEIPTFSWECPAVLSKFTPATTPTTSVSHVGTTASDIFPSTKLFGLGTTTFTPGTHMLKIPSNSGNPS